MHHHLVAADIHPPGTGGKLAPAVPPIQGHPEPRPHPDLVQRLAEVEGHGVAVDLAPLQPRRPSVGLAGRPGDAGAGGSAVGLRQRRYVRAGPPPAHRVGGLVSRRVRRRAEGSSPGLGLALTLAIAPAVLYRRQAQPHRRRIVIRRPIGLGRAAGGVAGLQPDFHSPWPDTVMRAWVSVTVISLPAANSRRTAASAVCTKSPLPPSPTSPPGPGCPAGRSPRVLRRGRRIGQVQLHRLPTETRRGLAPSVPLQPPGDQA